MTVRPRGRRPVIPLTNVLPFDEMARDAPGQSNYELCTNRP